MEYAMMGFWKNKLKRRWKIAFVSVITIGLFTHFYKFTNTLLMNDSVTNFYSKQLVLGSGRWFLTFACGISSYFDLPWVNGILSLFYIGLTAIIISELFQMGGEVQHFF